jgi:hypothetical protein
MEKLTQCKGLTRAGERCMVFLKEGERCPTHQIKSSDLDEQANPKTRYQCHGKAKIGKRCRS